jgi:hypothetical protein
MKDQVLFDQFFVNGQLQQMARYPNYDKSVQIYNGTASDATSAKQAQHWNNPSGAFVHALHKAEWGDFHYLVYLKNPPA